MIIYDKKYLFCSCYTVPYLFLSYMDDVITLSLVMTILTQVNMSPGIVDGYLD